MRILTLEFAGLGPYRGEQTIDFTSLEQDGLYLIAGRTGAGKSTILDAIVFALYGSVPRFDGGEKHLRSDHCEPGDETWVRLEFEAGGQRYRIRRSPDYERPKSRGTGTTTQKAAGVLERGGPAWEGVSTSLREIGELMPELVGLTGAEFLQVTLLAQNRFSEFLLAPNDKRQALLRRLFGTHRFDLLRRRVVDRARDAGKELELDRQLLEQTAEQLAAAAEIDAPTALEQHWFETVAEQLAPALAELEQRWRLVDAEAAAAEAALTAARSIAEQQARRDAALERRALLDAQQPEIDVARAELELARRVEALRPLADAEREARRRAAAAAERSLRADADYRALEHAPDPDAAAADADALQSAIGALDAALEEEQRLPRLEREQTAAEGAVRDADLAIEQLAARSTALPTQIAELAEQVGADQRLAVLVPARRESVDALRARRTAAEQLTAATERHQRAAAAVLETSAAHSAAVAEHDRLLRARFAGFAGELAATLVDGVPCPVCGATEHPAPAAVDHGDAATAEMVDAARKRADAQRHAAETAQTAEREAATSVDRLRTAAGDDDAERLQAATSEADEQLRLAQEAAARAPETERRRGELVEELADLDRQRERLRTERESAAEHRAALTAELQGVRERVEAARGQHPSVSERRAELQRHRERAVAVVAAAGYRDGTASALEDATTALVDGLAERGLERDDVDRGQRGAADVARLESQLRAHDDALASTAASIAEANALDLPEERVDLDAPEQRMRVARGERDSLAQQRSTLAHRDAELRRLAGEALVRLERDAERREAAERLRRLAETLDGKGPNTKRMDLEAFVLAARLEQIVDAANSRLGAMTGGRFSLEHDDSVQYRNTGSGLGIRILDAFTGRRRIPSSLSGGETFLASLALALGLADVVTAESGGVRLETLFIDEGFGSLDPETLEIAMATLDGLRAGGRTVGLISHVDAMKERIPIGVQVEVGPRGDSTLRQS